MKYHEKLNLKSPIYKYNNTNSKTPSKSPLKTTINPSDLFQKVCCPNCKYAFKIIKQQILKDTPILTATPTNKNFRKQQKQTQTQGILTVSNSNSPNKVLKSPQRLLSSNENGIQNSRKSQFSRLNQMLEAQNVENRYTKQSDFKFKPLSVSPKTKKSKSNNLLKTLAPQKIQYSFTGVRQLDKSPKQTTAVNKYQRTQNNFVDEQYNRKSSNQFQREYSGIDQDPYRKQSEGHVSFVAPDQQDLKNSTHRDYGTSNYEEQKDAQKSDNNTITISIKKQKQSSNLKNKNNQNLQISSNQKQIHSKNQTINKMSSVTQDPVKHAEIQNLITGMVLQTLQNQNVLYEFKQFFKQVSEEIQTPSYFKMLAFSE